MMEPRWKSGAIGQNGQPKTPVYAIGKVLECVMDYRNNCNLADLIDDDGHFDLLRFYTLHEREITSMSSIVLGQIDPHISTEVDCNSFSSEAGFLADKRHSKIGTQPPAPEDILSPAVGDDKVHTKMED